MKEKISLLSERDIENLKLKEVIDESVQPKLDKAIEDIINKEYKDNNADRDEIDDSYMRGYKLERLYDKHSQAVQVVVVGVFLLALFIALFNGVMQDCQGAEFGKLVPNYSALTLLFAVAVTLIIQGIKGIIIRRQIKDNLKQLEK